MYEKTDLRSAIKDAQFALGYGVTGRDAIHKVFKEVGYEAVKQKQRRNGMALEETNGLAIYSVSAVLVNEDGDDFEILVAPGYVKAKSKKAAFRKTLLRATQKLQRSGREQAFEDVQVLVKAAFVPQIPDKGDY